MKRFFLLLLAFTPCYVAAQQFSSLEERMSAADFQAAGLDKLSAEELARLNEWLRGNVGRAAVAAPGVPAGDRVGFRERVESGPVVSQIDGPFTGWSGNTRFRLKNGQVWQQIDNDARMGGVQVDSPTVTIEPGLFDSWMLRVEGYNSRVRVKRVK